MADLLKETTSSINTISQSISSTRSSLSSLSSSVNRISLIISNKTKVRTDLILKNVQIENRRREEAKRKKLEDQIEASKVSTNIRSGLNVASSTGKGPLGRILSFLGYLGAGWILENLPTWIAMGKEFIARMRKAGELIYSIPQTMWRILQNFGTLLSSVKQNIINLDFKDSSGEVRDSFKELTDSMQLLGEQIYGGFASLMQPSGEVKIPSTGEQESDANIGFPEVSAPTSGGSGGGGRWKPLLDLISSVESSTDKKNNGYDAQNGAPNGVRPGLSQMTIGEIARNAPGASGRYQQMPQFLLGRAKAAGFNEKTIFSASVQDTLAIKLIEGRGGNSWLSGKMKTEDFMQGLADEWAAIPNAYGQFSYSGQSSSLKPEKVKSVLAQVKQTPSTPSTPTVTPRTPTVPPPPKSQSGGNIYQYFHGEPGRAGYDPKGHWNHDHFSFTTRAAAVKAFEALKAKGFKPYEFEGYGRKMPPNSHSATGGHFGPAGGKPTYDDTSDGTAFDIPYSSYGSGPIGPKDYAKSREAYKIVSAAIGSSAEASSTIAAKSQSIATTPLVGQKPSETSAANQPTEQPYVPTAQELEVQKAFNQELQSIIQGTSSTDQPQISYMPTGQFGGIEKTIVPERKGQEILFIDDRSRSSSSISKSIPGRGSSNIKSAVADQQGSMLNMYMKRKLLLDLNYV